MSANQLALAGLADIGSNLNIPHKDGAGSASQIGAKGEGVEEYRGIMNDSMSIIVSWTKARRMERQLTRSEGYQSLQRSN